MTDYKVPKRAVLAEARLTSIGVREWELFLSDVAETRAGPERVSDLLNRKSRFLPVKDAEHGHHVVNTASVLVVSVPIEAELDDLGAEDLAADMSVSTEVEITLRDGHVVSGTLVYLQPQGQQRLQDFLNSAPTFIAVRDGTRAHVLNTHCVVSVRTLAAN